MFANRYIEKNINYPEFINASIADDLGIIVVIPCYREPNIIETLNSLSECDSPSCSVEIIVVVNQSENDNDKIIRYNKETYQLISDWERKNDRENLKVYPIYPVSFKAKFAGAGLARKIGMDEAIRRFAKINNEEGIIVSLDADTIVERNYLTEIERHFEINNDVAATIKFKHRIREDVFTEKLAEGIDLYERYLHYYKKSLAYTGYPFALYTIGSAFCVKSKPYIQQGGMNKKKAGEDFYFLHKLSQIGNISEINTTCVYPEARLSDRVPFGTGPVLQKWLNGEEDINMTYNFSAFIDLKKLFDFIPELYKADNEGYKQIVKNLPVSIREFLLNEKFDEILNEINSNSSGYDSFRKRFFQNFNAFKILKFINFSHEEIYENETIEIGVSKLKSASTL